MTDFMPGGEPFFHRGGRTGALLIHGFTGAPREMRPLGRALAAAGHSVLGVRLAHHGTCPEDMFRTDWRDWFHSVLDGYYVLREQCDDIFAMGLSLGGMLALHLAASYPVAGVVGLSTPAAPLLASMDWRSRLAGPLSLVIRWAPKGPPDPEADPDHAHYPTYPVRAVPALRALLRAMSLSLPAVTAPVLLIHSRADHGVPAENADYILRRAGSADKECVWLERSGHVITEGPEQEQVLERILNFVRSHGHGGAVAAHPGGGGPHGT